MRRLRRAGGPRRRDGPDPLGRDQRLPGAGRGVRRARGRDGGGPGPARPAAPGPARDGRAGRLAMRLLHARFHLLDGGRVLPAGPAAGGHRRARSWAERVGYHRHRQRRAPGRGRKRRRGARPERLRPARAQRQPVPLHRLPADQGRGLCPGPARGGRPVPGPAGRTRAGPGRHHELEHPGPLRPPGRPNRGIGAAGRRAGRPAGGRVHRLGRRAEHQAHQGRAERRHRPDRRAARAHRGPGQHRHRRRAEPVRDRGPAGRPACRCWTSCGRSSRRG